MLNSEVAEAATQLAQVGPAPRLAVEWQGRGPLVLFLHGLGGNRTNWHDQLPAFAPEFTAAAWDARGYGDSDDYGGPLRFADFSEDVVRVCDHFGADTCHLVGLSMGGRIALDFAGRYPKRVASLVLADTSGGIPDDKKRGERDEAMLRQRRSPLAEGREPRDIASALARTLVSPAIRADRLSRLEASLASLRKESYLKTLDEVSRYNGFPALDTLLMPCLVLAGEHDAIASPELARKMAARIHGAKFEMLRGAGHVSNIEEPDGFNVLVLEFLRSVERARGRTK